MTLSQMWSTLVVSDGATNAVELATGTAVVPGSALSAKATVGVWRSAA